jgi:hypothetical protein
MFTLRNVFVILTLVMASSASAAEPDAVPTTAPTDSPEFVIGQVKYRANAISDVIENIRDQYPAAILIDWTHLDIDRETPFTMVEKNVRLRDLVTKVFATAAAEKCTPVVEVIDNAIVVMNRDRMAKLHQRLERHWEQEIAEIERDGSARPDELRFRMLHRVPSIDSDATEFGDLVTFLHVATGAPIKVDWDSLGNAGVTRTTKVRKVFGGTMLETALNLILADLSSDKFTLDFKYSPDGISIYAEPAAAATTAPADPGEIVIPAAKFADNRLIDVVAHLRDLSGANIMVEWDQVGSERDADVTREFKQVATAKILADVFADGLKDKPKPAIGTVDGVILVTTPDRLKDLKSTLDGHAKADRPGGSDAAKPNRDDGRKDPLASRVPAVNFDAVAIADVFNNLADLSRIQVDVDWDSLKLAGINKETEVTVVVRDARLDTILSLILLQRSTDKFKLDYKLVDGKIRVTAEAAK